MDDGRNIAYSILVKILPRDPSFKNFNTILSENILFFNFERYRFSTGKERSSWRFIAQFRTLLFL